MRCGQLYWITDTGDRKPETGEGRPERGDRRGETGEGRPEREDRRGETGGGGPERGDRRPVYHWLSHIRFL